MPEELPTWLCVIGCVVAFFAFGGFMAFFFSFDRHEEERDPAAGLRLRTVEQQSNEATKF